MMKFITLCLTVFIGNALADEFLPSNILMMDKKFAHHVILVEKTTHKAFLYENTETYPRLVKTYNSVTGKFKGDKANEGDHKTPEGIYTIYEFLSKEELLKRHGKYAEIYGSGAFPMDYPNFIDHREGKKGGGIWLHSTDDDNRIAKGLDSRGCVVLGNADLREISQYIELQHTPIIVVQDVFWLSKNSWERNRKDIADTVNKWSKSWQEKNFDGYISTYDQNTFFDNSKGNYHAYKAYKKAVFSRPDTPSIKFDHMSILVTDPHSQYAVVHVEQDYRSSIINDVGKKSLYLRKDSNYEWKIVGEVWQKSDSSHLAFTPSKRYFKE